MGDLPPRRPLVPQGRSPKSVPNVNIGGSLGAKHLIGEHAGGEMDGAAVLVDIASGRGRPRRSKMVETARDPVPFRPYAPGNPAAL